MRKYRMKQRSHLPYYEAVKSHIDKRMRDIESTRVTK